MRATATERTVTTKLHIPWEATTSRQLGSLPAPEDREARQGFEESGLNAAIRSRGRSPGRIRNEANNTLRRPRARTSKSGPAPACRPVVE